MRIKYFSAIEREREQLKELCKRFDHNKDGFLSKQDLEKLFKALGSQVAAYRAFRALSHADVNRDGYIGEEDLDKLVNYLIECGYSINPPRDARRNSPAKKIADMEIARLEEKVGGFEVAPSSSKIEEVVVPIKQRTADLDVARLRKEFVIKLAEPEEKIKVVRPEQDISSFKFSPSPLPRLEQNIRDYEIAQTKEEIAKGFERISSSPIIEPKKIVRAISERVTSTINEDQPNNIVQQMENATEQSNSGVKEEKLRMVLSEQQINSIFKKFDPDGERIILKKKLMFSFYHFGTLFPQFGHIDISDADKDGFIKLKNLDALVDYAIKRGYTVK